tara:strand:- start:426 stop:737 length:312 start_codon:yes stop_codon:yes gene_type:complete
MTAEEEKAYNLGILHVYKNLKENLESRLEWHQHCADNMLEEVNSEEYQKTACKLEMIEDNRYIERRLAFVTQAEETLDYAKKMMKKQLSTEHHDFYEELIKII